jgi:hypothetical protein
MNFSLKAVIDILDAYPEDEVLSCILQLYERPRGVLFNDKFIARADAMVMGYTGFKKILYSIYEIDESFLERCLTELRALISLLKGENQDD